MNSRVLLAIVAILMSNCWAQSDSVKTLSLEEYLSIVATHHPVAKQADLITKMGRANLLKARGEFDPQLKSDLDNKYFESKNYWFMLDAKLEVPTWYGIEFQAGYQYWQGDYFDLHERTPDIGLPYAGVSVSLGKGMFMDDRMAALKQAKVYNQMAEFERRELINLLFYESTQAYLDWTYKFYQNKILKDATDLALVRYKSTVVQFRLGDKPAIDTLEMYSVYQSRMLSFIQANNEFRNAQLTLSNFLWLDNLVPAQINDSILPNLNDSLYQNELFNNDSLTNLLSRLSSINPVLNQLQLKQRQLQIDKTLKTNKLLPTLDITYNFLYSENYNTYFINNYKLGAQFKMPLFFRREIGDLKLAKYKLQDNQLKTELKVLETRNKVQMYYNDYNNQLNQLKTNYSLLSNYKRLLDAEIAKFQLGESTVFMVNSRETKYLETLIKVKEIESKVVKSLYSIFWAAGNLMDLN